MQEEQGLTKEELQAARVYLERRHYFAISPTPYHQEACLACNAKKTTGAAPTVRHYGSKPHIAGVYGITLSRLTTAIKVAKVMEALDA